MVPDTLGVMYVFYDFETSSRDLLGQILTYCFVATDTAFNHREELSGSIKLNPTELPEPEAIMVNKIDIDLLQKTGDSEADTARKIFSFLDGLVSKNRTVTLVGYNSNQFDLAFLRNLLIRYGYNPYFKGKLKNIDCLHYVQSIAFQNVSTFPWTRVQTEKSSYYSFKLEDTAQSLHLLSEAQTHQAKDDVLLLISLIQTLQTTFQNPFHLFQSVSFVFDPFYQGRYQIAKFKTRHFAEVDTTPEKFIYRYVVQVGQLGKSLLLVDLSKYQDLALNHESLSEENLLSCVQYINPNKHFMILEPLSNADHQQWDTIADQVGEEAFYHQLSHTPQTYFDLTKKDWDIVYQIHELGFERIDTLRDVVQELLDHPDHYNDLLQRLMKQKKEPKDIYLIRLFNRAYLNIHPDVRPDFAAKYITPRYVTGSLLKQADSFVSLDQRYEKIEALLKDDTLSETDYHNLTALRTYYDQFLARYQLHLDKKTITT